MCNPLSLLFIHNAVLSDPLHHSTHWHYITSNQNIPKKNHTQYLYCMSCLMTPATLYLKRCTWCVLFLLEMNSLPLNYLYFQLIGYLTSCSSSKYMSFRGICSHFSMTFYEKMISILLVHLSMKTSTGLWQDFFHLFWHKSTAITVTLFKLLLFWMCQFCPRDLL